DRGPCTSHCHRARAGVVRPPMTLPVITLLLALSPAERAASSRITANEISAHLRFLSDDQIEGRKPGSAGDELAIKYLASQLEAMGYQPAGDKGSFLQAVPLVELAADVPRDVAFKSGGKDLVLHAGNGLQADLVLGPSAHKERGTVKDAGLVFVGYGITAPEYGWDDYKDVDVRGNDLDTLRKSAESRDFRPVPLASTMSLDLPVSLKMIRSDNVVGMLPGTDPALRGEAVLYTAHHDHLGRVQPIPPATDGIYNGALDNASGCATVLAIARAMTFAPPKRSVIVAFVTAEEQNLLGSRWLAQHPPIPANRIAADTNLDSVNRWGRTTDLGVMGLGKSTADDVVRKVAADQGRTVHGDPHPDR